MGLGDYPNPFDVMSWDWRLVYEVWPHATDDELDSGPLEATTIRSALEDLRRAGLAETDGQGRWWRTHR